jgi:hypothetical protein
MKLNKANELTTINSGTAHVGFDPAGNWTAVRALVEGQAISGISP